MLEKTDAALRVVRYEGSDHGSPKSAHVDRAWGAKIPALIPGEVYAYRLGRWTDDGGPLDALGPAIEIIMPPAIWVSTTELRKQNGASLAPFEVVDLPISPGSSATATAVLREEEFDAFRSGQRPKRNGPRHSVCLNVDVVWAADEPETSATVVVNVAPSPAKPESMFQADCDVHGDCHPTFVD
jgi:hypothetical protein